MALNRLCVCTGWSEPLLVAHTALLEISCRGSNVELWDWPRTLREESTGDRQTGGLTERFAISPSLFNRVRTRSVQYGIANQNQCFLEALHYLLILLKM